MDTNQRLELWMIELWRIQNPDFRVKNLPILEQVVPFEGKTINYQGQFYSRNVEYFTSIFNVSASSLVC